MNEIDWLTLLTASVPMNERFLSELRQQACEHARQLTGIDLTSGEYAFMPPDGDFAPEFYQTIDADGNQHTVGCLCGDLVGPDANAYPAVLAWRSKERRELGVAPDADPSTTGALEFFWAQFPISEFRTEQRTSASWGGVALQTSFALDISISRWPDITFGIQGKRPLSGAEVAAIEAALDGAIEDWNAMHEGKIHYRSRPEMSAESDKLVLYIDFGTASQDALVALVRALDSSAMGRSASFIARCTIGAGQRPPHR